MSAVAAAIIGGGAAIVGGIGGAAIASGGMNSAADKQSQGAVQAAQIQSDANKYAIDEQKRQYDMSLGIQQPWIDASKAALPTLQNLANNPGSFSFNKNDLMQDPSYQFNMDQGMKALQRSAAAKGGLMSGGAMKDIASFSQGLASNEFGNAYNRAYNRFLNDRDVQFNRLSAIAGIGQQAPAGLQAISGNISNLAQAGGQALGNTYASNANAQAANTAAQGNMWGNTLSGLGSGISNNFMQYASMNNMNNWMNRMLPQQQAPMSFSIPAVPNMAPAPLF